jgi:hypothetical protein
MLRRAVSGVATRLALSAASRTVCAAPAAQIAELPPLLKFARCFSAAAAEPAVADVAGEGAVTQVGIIRRLPCT